MMEKQSRLCNTCGYPVTYYTIDEDPMAPIVHQFVAIVLHGDIAGLPAVVDYCPKCGQELTLETTIAKPKDENR